MISIAGSLRTGEFQTEESRFGFRLLAIATDLTTKNAEFTDVNLDPIIDAINEALERRYHEFYAPDGNFVQYYRAFTEDDISGIVDALSAAVAGLGGVTYREGHSEDAPLPFRGADLADHLEDLAYQENRSQYLEFLIARIRTFLSDPKMSVVVEDSEGITLDQWLKDYLGSDESGNGTISVVDLSLVPSEVVHIVTAVIARIIFEALQRYVKLNGVALPTVIVMEEAHTFIRRYRYDTEQVDAATVCCQAFERIAREGRKFGLGLVLSSQRPYELSPDVLSQCNTFLLHQLSNDRDQELVGRLVPDNLKGLLRELPSLPSQTAILLGWASELPVLVRMNDLPSSHRPRSDDPEFWKVWTGEEQREVNWGLVADDWTELSYQSDEEQQPDED